jgi:hypothetical protein
MNPAPHHYHHHRRHHHHHLAPGDRHMGSGSNGTSPNNGVSGNANPGSTQTANSQNNQ